MKDLGPLVLRYFGTLVLWAAMNIETSVPFIYLPITSRGGYYLQINKQEDNDARACAGKMAAQP